MSERSTLLSQLHHAVECQITYGPFTQTYRLWKSYQRSYLDVFTPEVSKDLYPIMHSSRNKSPCISVVYKPVITIPLKNPE